MFVGFPRLGAGVAVARTSDAAVTSIGSVDGTPEAVRWAVARNDWMALVTELGWPPTGAHRGILRSAISNKISKSADLSCIEAQHVGLDRGEPAQIVIE